MNKADVDKKVNDLLAQMTIDEKIGQLIQFFYFGGMPDAPEPIPGFIQPSVQRAHVEKQIAETGIGSALFITDPEQINSLQKKALETSRLGIPLIFGYDVIHGFRTIFPVPIAMAASWDPEIVEAGQRVAAKEARSTGLHWTFAPMLDIARDPRWGRMIEGAGEDPFLGAAIAVAQVKGFQGEEIGTTDHIISGPKHFVGYGAALGGRDYDEAEISDSQLHNVYFPPFKAAIEAGAGNVMTAYMGLNGVPATGNKWLFTDILRKEWGFDGFVVSDANAVFNLTTHHFTKDAVDAGAAAVNAGVDLEMAIAEAAMSHLKTALEQGKVTEETITESARRILTAKVKMGIFENPYVDSSKTESVLKTPEHKVTSRLAAEKSFVLLKNEGSLLPLDPNVKQKIAVLGPLATSPREILGPWCFQFDLDESVTIIDGIKAKAGANTSIEYAQGVTFGKRHFPSMFDMFADNNSFDPEGFDADREFKKAVDLAKSSDVAIIVIGENQNMIGEAASRSSIELPPAQLELLKAVHATGTKVVALVMNGRPLDLRWADENIEAIVDIWYPGTRGGDAVANLLFGEVAPGGKLPFTWPRTVGQIPMIYSHHISHQPEKQDTRYWDEESTPLYPFGHGLSYGTIEITDLTLDKNSISPNDSQTITVNVRNTGSRRGDEVVQLYIHQRYGSAIRPIRELKGFKRISLEPGESKKVTLTLTPDHRRYWSAQSKSWVLEKSTFDLWVGSDSRAELSTTFEVK